MHRSLLVILSLLVPLAAFSAVKEKPWTYKQMINANVAAISQVQVGMTKDQVMQTMTTRSAKVPDGLLSNPWKTESFARAGESYEVLYYLVRIHPPFTPILDSQAQTVVLKNGTVVGVGRAALNALRE